VFVDPGHGGVDPGAVTALGDGRRLVEKDLTLAVALKLARLLRAAGYRVVLARTGDTSVVRLGQENLADGAMRPTAARLDLQARIACANSSGASALLSIHFNAFDDPAVGGAQTFYDDARAFAAGNRTLARLIQSNLVSHLPGTADRGILADSELDAPALSEVGADYGRLLELGPAQAGFLEPPSASPGVLTEPLFLSSPAEAELAASERGQAQIAAGLAAGLQAFLSRA